jgi:hypothetical protein
LIAVRHRPRVACAALAWVIVAQGCSAYDPDLLQRARMPPGADSIDAHVPGAGAGGSAGTGGRAGAGAGGRAGAGGAAGDAGVMDARVSADAQPDLDGAPADGAVDSGGDGAITDAGCGEGDGAHDCCPDDPDKTAPGMCGCGTADADADGDGTADCVDGCPADAMKTAAGVCGCGRPDSDQGAVVSCAGLRDALVHRYRFDGSGTTVTDSRGDHDGVVINTQLDGAGQLDLAGGSSDEYVDLPNGLISALTDATFEVWLTWNGGNGWQRIFDFGDSDAAAEGAQGTGTSYLFLTPRTAGSSSVLRVSFTTSGSGSETRISASSALASSGTHHLAVVIDDGNDQMHLYQDGASVGSVAFSGSLSAIDDVNNWLGRSQYGTDPELDGSLHELRIYGAPLSAAQIALSFADGPDPAYLEP